MSATSILIIYYTESKLMRGVFYPDKDSELAHRAKSLRPGESTLVVKYTELPEHPTLPSHHTENCRIHLASKIGTPAHNGRCVLVPKGAKATPSSPVVIEQTLFADPAVDTLPDHDLHLHDEAGAGWTFDGAEFRAP